MHNLISTNDMIPDQVSNSDPHLLPITIVSVWSYKYNQHTFTLRAE